MATQRYGTQGRGVDAEDVPAEQDAGGCRGERCGRRCSTTGRRAGGAADRERAVSAVSQAHGPPGECLAATIIVGSGPMATIARFARPRATTVGGRPACHVHVRAVDHPPATASTPVCGRARRRGHARTLPNVTDERCGLALVRERGLAGAPYLVSIAVAEAFRSQGVGPALLRLVEAHYRGPFPPPLPVRLVVQPAGPAFYERHGFEAVGVLKATSSSTGSTRS